MFRNIFLSNFCTQGQMAMEQAIDVCGAYDGYLAFTHKPPLKKIIIKKKCNGNEGSTSFEEEQLSRKNL